MSRIYLSPPDVGRPERDAVLRAFDSGWIAPVGPEVDAFEAEFARRVGAAHAVALSSGTAALHLALVTLGIGPGDVVMLPTLTFAATANVVKYVGARPVLVDSSPESWNIDPDLLESELRKRAAHGEPPAAVITVDLYGQCADYDRIAPVCEELGIHLVSDAAEALGATYRGREAGSFGEVAAFSFNGNKIITTSGGGMLVTPSEDLAAKVKYLSTQARQPVVHYEHHDIGYNYRLSNLLAALGRAQLAGLDHRVDRRRRINRRYRDALGGLPGIGFSPVSDYGEPNYWLTCVTIDPEAFGADRRQVLEVLEKSDIEARPTWKPLHLQPVFADLESVGGEVAAGIFDRGLCLPSGSSLTDDQQDLVLETFARAGT